MKKSEKAYKNIDFLSSRDARSLRILAEYLEPEKRFREENIWHTVVFFGSSRIRPEGGDKYETSKYYWAAEELAFKLASWAKKFENEKDRITVCSGGGPGIMEAADRGAVRAGARSIGLNISLPMEQECNQYISPELNFEFHYFFMRKLWFIYHAKAIVVFPGGFGTLDELFEVLTLIQTRKLQKPDLPVLLYDKAFWEGLINFDVLLEKNLISEDDLSLCTYFDTPEEGFEILIPYLKEAVQNFKN